MSSLNVRLEDSGYRNWVKAGLCLALVKEGLEGFADEKSIELHKAVLNHLRNRCSPVIHGVCSNAHVVCNRSTRKFEVRCSCMNCHGYLEELYKLRSISLGASKSQQFTFRQGNFDNSDVQKWPHKPWEVAKLFMNPGQKSSNQSPKDTDLSGILNFIDHCSIARKDVISTGNISDVRDSRNKIMHSATLIIADQDFNSYTDAMIDLLEDGKVLSGMPDAKEAVSHIKEIKKSDFRITTEKESSVLKEQTANLISVNEGIQRDIRDIQASLRNLDGAYVDRITMFKEFQEEIKLREAEMKQVIDTLQKIKLLLIKDESLKKNLEADIREINKSLESTREQLQSVQRDLEAIKSRLDILEKRADETEIKTSELQKKTDRVESDVDILYDRTNNLENRVNTLQSPPVSLDKKTFRKDCIKLQEHLVFEYKQLYSNVSLSPIYDSLNAGVPSASVEELRANVHIVRMSGSKEVDIESYNDIFFTGKRKNRTILIKGIIGVGKSTWCLQIINAWCKAHAVDSVESEKQVIKVKDVSSSRRLFSACFRASNKGGLKSERSFNPLYLSNEDLQKTMLQFDFLFFISLRHVQSQSSVMDMIFSSSLQRISHFYNVFRQIMKETSEAVLIVLDEMDAYDSTLDFQGLNQSTVIVLTRPWKYDVICAEAMFNIDEVFTVKGLKQEDLPKVAETFLDMLLPLIANTKDRDYECNSDDDSDHNSDNSDQNLAEAGYRNLAEKCLNQIESVGLADSITTPLSFLIIVQSWLENRNSLSSSLTSNIIRMLKAIVLRGEEKKTKNYVLCDKKTILRSLQDSGSTRFTDDEVLLPYFDLFLRLGELSYESLLSSTASLEFTESDLHAYIGPEEFKLCLELGLLSKSKVYAWCLQSKVINVSFHHELMKELFAALWIINNERASSAICSALENVRDVLRMENVLKFICNLHPSLGSMITSLCTDICGNDRLVIATRKDIGPSYIYENLKKLTLLFMKCQNEINESKCPNETVFINDILRYGKCNDLLQNLISQSINHLQSVVLYQLYLSYKQINQLFWSLNNAVFLQKLEIAMTKVLETDTEDSDMTGLDLSKCDLLETLKICCSGERCINRLALGNNCNLQDVSLANLALTESCWKHCFASHAFQYICRLKIRELSNEDIVINLENCIQLQSLCLEDVEASEVKLNHNVSLRELIMYKVTMAQSSSWTKLFKTLQFTGIRKLALWSIKTCRVQAGLDEITIADKSEPTDFSVVSELLDVTFCNVTLSHSQWEFVCGLFRPGNMLSIKLSNIDMKEAILRLEKLQTLDLLSLKTVSLSDIKFERDLMIHRISFKSVQFTQACCENLFSDVFTKYMHYLSLQQLSVPITLELCLDVVQLRDLEVIDMDIPPYGCLRHIELRNLRMFTYAWKTTLERIQSATRMQSFALETLDLDDAVIDFSNCSALECIDLIGIKVFRLRLGNKNTVKEVYLNKIEMPKPSWNLFFASLSMHALRSLSLENLDISDLTINIDRAKSLMLLKVIRVQVADIKICDSANISLVVLESIKMPKRSWGRFFQRFGLLTISEIKLKNLDIGKAVICLDKNNRLERLSVVDVKMSKECYRKILSLKTKNRSLNDIRVNGKHIST